MSRHLQTETSSLPQPAVWVELPDAPGLTSEQQDRLQQEAEDLQAFLSEPPPDLNPGLQRLRWQRAVADSDFGFRQKYGQQLWMQHHVQSHHLYDP